VGTAPLVARNDIHVDAPAEHVFDVLADPSSYAYWVVGSRAVRDADDDWPDEGARFHHTVAFGPLTLRDHTQVEEVERPHRLVLRARTRPVGAQRVELTLDPRGDGTLVTMEESPIGLPAHVAAPPLDLVLRGRNEEGLKRLKQLAEERYHGSPGRDAPPGGRRAGHRATSRG
jgi:uncharacterized protein YndB with AHSA1/START domain